MIIARTKNAVTGTLWGIVYRIIATVFPFVIRTVILKEFGSEYLGLNSLFTAILQVLSLSELGLSSAIIFSMYKPIAEDDYKSLSALLAFYRKLFIYIGCIILVLGLGCLPFLDHLINGTYPDDINLQLLYLIFLSNTCISYFFFAYKEALLSAYQRNDIINIIRSIVFVAQFVLQLIVLLLLKDYYLYAFMMVVFTLLRGYLNYVMSNKLYPQIKCYGTVEKDEVETIKTNIFGIAIGKFCVVSRGASNNIIISFFIGLTNLAIFDNYYYVISAVTAIMVIMENSLVAGVGNSAVTETEEKNYFDFKKINFVFMWFAGICSVCLLCLYQPFMELWVGKELVLPSITMVLFCSYFFVGCFSSIPNVYAAATGLWWNMRFKSITEVIANVVLNIVFVQIWGINGVLIATILTLFFVTFLWTAKILYDNYFKERNFLDVLLLQFKYSFVTILAASITYFVCLQIETSSLWSDILWKLVVSVLLSNVLLYMFYRKSPYFGEIKKLIGRVIIIKKIEVKNEKYI